MGLLAVRDKNNNIKLISDIYAFSYTEKDDRINKEARIIFVGYCIKNKDFYNTTEDIIYSKYKEEFIKPGKILDKNKNTHLNLEIPYEKTRPIINVYRKYQKTISII